MAKPNGKTNKSTNKTADQKPFVAKQKKVKLQKGPVPDYTKRELPILGKSILTAYAEVSLQLDYAFGGFEGVYGIKVPATATDALPGILIIEVVKHRDIPVMFVRGSTVPGIPVKDDLYLPTSTLHQMGIKNFIGNEKAFAWQQNLHKVLKPIAEAVTQESRRALHEHLAQMKKKPVNDLIALATSRAAFVKAQAAEQGDIVEIDVSGAVDLSPAAFLHGKKDAPRLYLHRDANNQEAYFSAEMMGGNQALRLVVADEGHEMYKVFASQEALVHVHVSDLRADTRPYGDLKEIRNARECMRQYLKGLALSLGLKPKRNAEELNKEQQAA